MLANPETKAEINKVSGNVLPAPSSIGVTLIKTDAADGKYDNNSYNNVEYHTGDGTAWGIVTGSILLSATESTVYAYYPYDVAKTDIEHIAIDATDGTDYMYATPATGIKNSNASAVLTMNHALSVVKFTIQKASTNGYTGAGVISSVKLEGATLGSQGSMNIKTQTVTAEAGALEYTTPLKLTPSAEGEKNQAEVFAVPTGTQSTIKFSVSMDGQTYTATTGEVRLEKGQQYAYTLNMSSTGLTVSTVNVTPWGDPQDIAGSGDAELYKTVLTWDEAKTKDGVYAVKEDGTPVAYDKATDDTYSAVAFVVNGKAYQVAKVDVSGYDTYPESITYNCVHWWFTDHRNIEELFDYDTADGSNTKGYLKGLDGTLLSPNYNEWEYGALSDFNGESNTNEIMVAQNNGDDIDTIAFAVKKFREGSNNENMNDWFVPALGELAYMSLKQDELDDLLIKIAGFPFSTRSYWSSSEHNDNKVWTVNLSNGYVRTNLKNDPEGLLVRLIRAI